MPRNMFLLHYKYVSLSSCSLLVIAYLVVFAGFGQLQDRIGLQCRAHIRMMSRFMSWSAADAPHISSHTVPYGRTTGTNIHDVFIMDKYKYAHIVWIYIWFSACPTHWYYWYIRIFFHCPFRKFRRSQLSEVYDLTIAMVPAEGPSIEVHSLRKTFWAMTIWCK